MSDPDDRYTAVRYDCSSPSVARWISRLAKKIGLTDSDFKAFVQTTAEQIAALPPAAPDHQPAIDHTTPTTEADRAPDQEVQTASVQAPAPSQPVQLKPPVPAPPALETAETEAERKQRYREILGIDEPKPRRRWRR